MAEPLTLLLISPTQRADQTSGSVFAVATAFATDSSEGARGKGAFRVAATRQVPVVR